MGTGSARVDHPLGDALMVEMGDFFSQVVVLQEHRAPGPCLQRVVSVPKLCPMAGGEGLTLRMSRKCLWIRVLAGRSGGWCVCHVVLASIGHRGRLWIKHDLDAAVFLFLELRIQLWSLGQWRGVRDEVVKS